MTELATLDAYGVLTEPATLKIQRLLPGPIERVWAYLTESDLRRQWLAAGEMEMKVGAPFELVWRNDELTNPPGQRPAGFPEEHRMQSRITELDPPRKLAIAWRSSGDVSFELEPTGQRGAAHRDPSPPARPRDHADGRRRLAHAPRHSGRPRDRQGAGAVLGRLEPPQEGIRPADAGLTEVTLRRLRSMRRSLPAPSMRPAGPHSSSSSKMRSAAPFKSSYWPLFRHQRKAPSATPPSRSANGTR